MSSSRVCDVMSRVRARLAVTDDNGSHSQDLIWWRSHRSAAGHTRPPLTEKTSNYCYCRETLRRLPQNPRKQACIQHHESWRISSPSVSQTTQIIEQCSEIIWNKYIYQIKVHALFRLQQLLLRFETAAQELLSDQLIRSHADRTLGAHAQQIISES